MAALVRNYLEVYDSCAGGLSAVNAIGTHLSDSINSAELGKNPVSKHQIQPEDGEWAGWRGTGRLNPSRETLRHVRGQGNTIFPCSTGHEQDWQLYPVDPYSAICVTVHTYIHTLWIGRGAASDLAWVCWTSLPTTSPRRSIMLHFLGYYAVRLILLISST